VRFNYNKYQCFPKDIDLNFGRLNGWFIISFQEDGVKYFAYIFKNLALVSVTLEL